MAMNTIYKWLAETIQDQRTQVIPPDLKGLSGSTSLELIRERTREVETLNSTLDKLAIEFANKMEPKQPGSFDKQKFLEMAGVKQ